MRCGEVANGGGEVAGVAFCRTIILWPRDCSALGDEHCLDKC